MCGNELLIEPRVGRKILMGALLLFFTVFVAMCLGIVLGHMVISVFLKVLSHRPQEVPAAHQSQPAAHAGD